MLAQLHQRGLPVHRPTVAALLQQRVDLLPALVAAVVQHLPGLSAYPLALQSTKLAVAAPVQSMLAAYAQDHGYQLDTDARLRPLIGARSAKRSGAATLPGWQAWEQLQKAKRDLTAIGEWADLVAADGRVRPLFTPGAVTLRLTAQAPDSTGAPRASRELAGARPFRSVLRARDGHAIVTADYPQFELRIVAAVAQRAIATAREVLAGKGAASAWVIGALRRGETIAPLTPSAAGHWNWADGLATRGALYALAVRRWRRLSAPDWIRICSPLARWPPSRVSLIWPEPPPSRSSNSTPTGRLCRQCYGCNGKRQKR